MAWTKTISTKWEESVEDGSIAYYKVRAKIAKSEELTEKDIKVIKKYQEKNPDVVLDKEVYEALKEYSVKEIKRTASTNVEALNTDALLADAKNDYKAGKISKKEFDKIYKKVYSYGTEYTNQLINNLIQDGLSNSLSDITIQELKDSPFKISEIQYLLKKLV